MQRLTTDNLLREESGAVRECFHGFELDHEAQLCHDFHEAFRRGYHEKWQSGNHDMMSCFEAGLDAVIALKFTNIRMDKLVAYSVYEGTHYILIGHDRLAGVEASFAYYFEQFIATTLEKTQPAINWLGVAELQHCDLHTLVKFLRKRIPCKCLDEKYKEVKSMTKVGLCYNIECLRSGKLPARSEILYCERCGVGYCSTECQKAHWKLHKPYCNRVAREKAEFDAKQQQA